MWLETFLLPSSIPHPDATLVDPLLSVLIPLISVAGGAVGAKVIDAWLQKSRESIAAEQAQREAVWKELIDCRERIKAAETETVAWRERYYELRDKQAG